MKLITDLKLLIYLTETAIFVYLTTDSALLEMILTMTYPKFLATLYAHTSSKT